MTSTRQKTPKNENELIKQYLNFSYKILVRWTKKYYAKFLLLENQDLKTLSYIFLKEAWTRSLNKKIKNFKSYLFTSLSYSLMNYAKKCCVNPEDKVRFNPTVHNNFYFDLKTPESFVQQKQLHETLFLLINFLTKSEAKMIYDYLNGKHSLKAIAKKHKLSENQVKYLVRKTRLSLREKLT